ncbi:Ribonuclease H [Citrus sinensis]|nr:Ribonuclease H [Citrus sinensis]
MVNFIVVDQPSSYNAVLGSLNPEDHIKDLREIFDILRKYKMRLNPAKCAFGVSSGKFLDKCLPFFKALRKGKEMKWTEECEEAFQKLKEYLGSPHLLVKPIQGEPLFLYLAVSEHATSSILVREDDGVQRPIYYTSRALVDAETRYLSLEKIVLALIVSARRLRPYFQAHTIIVLTDQPIRQVLAKPDISGRMTKWAIELGEFDILYHPRTSLKRQAVANFIAEFTEGDIISLDPKEEHQDRWSLYVDGSSSKRGCGGGFIAITPDNVESVPVVIIPEPSIIKYEEKEVATIDHRSSWMDPIMGYLMNGTLPEDKNESKKVRYRATRYVIMDNQLYKRGYSLPLLKCLTPEDGDNGQVRFAIVAIDYFTKWVEAEPLATITEKRTTDFIQKNIICRYGVPHTIITDNGRQFDNDKFREFCRKLKIKNCYSSPAHPQANGQVEAANRVIKQILKAKLEKAKGAWPDELSFVLWSYRTTPRTPTGESPFSLAFGAEAVIPAEIGTPTYRVQHFDPVINDELQRQSLDLLEEKRDHAMIKVAAYQGKVARYYNARVKIRKFRIGDLVLKKVLPNAREPGVGTLGPNWDGPYIIREVVRPGTYILSTLGGKILRHAWNAEHLRIYHQ